jgi:protein-tyrosine phosphatase
MEYCKRYNLKTVNNLRDLGGYQSENGKVTKWQMLLRSANLSKTSMSDLQLLKQMGIRTVIDLRHLDECRKEPDICMGDENIKTVRISLLGELDPIKLGVIPSEPDTATLIHMYIAMMEQCKEQYRLAIEEIAEGLEHGAVLFHCAAGKDRTGIISMFLLSIVGVCQLDIVADYEVSRTYIQNTSEDISGSHYKNMEGLLLFLKEKYGSPVNYLRNIGVREETLTSIYHKML